ncbi:hypothetical protein CU669_19180 [Paramagnetospirillum kuznetsovii]|uniref:OmpA-like domain-containing protein n=1 Tax=Paramagnetospirillum kuznetsovii TaxID=2053833 RepID=A0A364NT80_9PROT|nr:OmpA family protein [Paramagnetospirillum kuznetsovii]RAU20291.1 hypothetical protein CU669_19180 [Paramagnetospirillum kuznetsovii]
MLALRIPLAVAMCIGVLVFSRDGNAQFAPSSRDKVETVAIAFERDRSDLTGAAKLKLNEVVNAMGAHSGVTWLKGHCAEGGSREYALALSERLGQSVKAYLVKVGLAPERLKVVGMGMEGGLKRGEPCRVDVIMEAPSPR